MRGRIEVIADILELLQESALSKTKIMYKANLSYGMLREYLTALVTYGLAMESPELTRHQQFQISERGREFVKHYSSIKQILA